MRMTLHYKLFGAILAAILIVVLYMTLVLQWSFDRGFLEYVNTAEYDQLKKISRDIEDIYAKYEDWSPLIDDPRKIVIAIVSSYPEGRQKERILKRIGEEDLHFFKPPKGPIPKDIPVHFFRRVFLLNASKNILMGFEPQNNRNDLLEILHRNQVVGYLGLHPAKHLSNSHHLIFVEQQKLTLFLVAVAGILISAGLSLPISYMLTKPIRRLAKATRSLASGKYQTRVAVQSGDEFGRLSQDFNDLASILEKNRKARSQWVADISHELRTPITILRGKIEALQDGVYHPNEETFSGLHREVMHLGLLVDDLYQLSLSDLGAMSYDRIEAEPCWALEQAVSLLEPEIGGKNLKLETQVNLSGDEAIFADNERLKQLFTNLLANSIRYTDENGRIRITVKREDSSIVYSIEDSVPGVSDEHLVKLFDRLFRVDSSRSRELGGAGLGLSICHNIVKGHNGMIEAKHSPLGGLLINVKLPLSE